jgi:predicted RNA-binding Zn-ribbon protein involved in translation (DUF1610 family)
MSVVVAVLLGLAVLGLGEKSFRDVAKIPTRPSPPRERYDAVIDSLMKVRQVISDSLSTYSSLASAARKKASEFHREFLLAREKYRMLLEERTAEGVTGGTVSEEARREEAAAKQRMEELERSWREEEATSERLQEILSGIHERRRAIEEAIRVRKKELWEAYGRAMRAYRMKVAMLRFALLLPFFLLAAILLALARRRRTPLTLHAVALLSAVTILAIRDIGEYAWDALSYYGALGFSALVLGILLYAIARSSYRPGAVEAKRMLQGRCASCGLPLAPWLGLGPAMRHCPACGEEVVRECPHCHGPSPAGFPHCSSCGASLVEA